MKYGDFIQDPHAMSWESGISSDNEQEIDWATSPSNTPTTDQQNPLSARARQIFGHVGDSTFDSATDKSKYFIEPNTAFGMSVTLRNAERYKMAEESIAHEIQQMSELLGKLDSTSGESIRGIFIEAEKIFGSALRTVYDGNFTGESHLESTSYICVVNNLTAPLLEYFVEHSDKFADKNSVLESMAGLVTSYSESFDGIHAERTVVLLNAMVQFGGIDSMPYIVQVMHHLNNEKYLYYEYTQNAYSSYSLPKLDETPNKLWTRQDLTYLSDESGIVHRQACAAISRHTWDSSEVGLVAETLSTLMSYDSAGSLHHYVAAYESLGVEAGYPVLLNNLKSEDVLVRRMSAEILFRLELGDIGVSAEGVNYLGKRYDLGNYNSTDVFVHRLDQHGHIGVVSRAAGKLEGYFDLALDVPEDVVKSEVRALVLKDLFMEKADETSQERSIREAYLQQFLAHYEEIYKDPFFEALGVRLNSLDLHEQGWFVLFYMEAKEKGDTATLEDLAGFASVYGEIGLKAFLTMDYGGSGTEIMEFAKSDVLSIDQKRELFSTYYRMSQEAIVWRNLFDEVAEKMGLGIAPQLHEAFIRKSSEFFRSGAALTEMADTDLYHELQANMQTILSGLQVLEGLYDPSRPLELKTSKKGAVVGRRTVAERSIADETLMVEDGQFTYELTDAAGTNEVFITIRPLATVKGEARIGFIVRQNKDATTQVRFSLDRVSDGSLSLDMGIGQIIPTVDGETTYPADRVAHTLVESVEGGHNTASFKDSPFSRDFESIARATATYLDTHLLNE